MDDALAPARMVEFIGGHIKSCAVCCTDSTVSPDPLKIRKMVLPFINARDPQKAARFEDILEHQLGHEGAAEEEKIVEEVEVEVVVDDDPEEDREF